MKPQTQQRVTEYPAHPVPRIARQFPHVAGYFASEGPRKLVGGTGDEIAASLTRNLTIDARRVVLG